MNIDITPEAVEHLCAIHEGYEQHGTVATLRALSAALTASQAETAAAYEAGRAGTHLRLSIARKIGMYGCAYDGPYDARAYTYEHLPGNQDAYGIGKAASNASKDRAGDHIDVGLSLLRHMNDAGFGVFALNKHDTLRALTPADSKAALDRMLAEARADGMREAVKILEATYAARINAGLESGFNAMMAAKEAILSAIPKGKDHE